MCLGLYLQEYKSDLMVSWKGYTSKMKAVKMGNEEMDNHLNKFK